jgi:hypothetical protein
LHRPEQARQAGIPTDKGKRPGKDSAKPERSRTFLTKVSKSPPPENQSNRNKINKSSVLYHRDQGGNPMPNNPLHSITLENMLTLLVEHYGWKRLGSIIKIRCFNNDPSTMSSLTFLRKTPWARKKIEELYLKTNRTNI